MPAGGCPVRLALGKPAWAGRGGGGGVSAKPRKGGLREGERIGYETVGEAATRYRAMLARCKFLGCEQPSVQFAANEASRWMAKPWSE